MRHPESCKQMMTPKSVMKKSLSDSRRKALSEDISKNYKFEKWRLVTLCRVQAQATLLIVI